ncbi:MAG: hypothetical protein GX075_06680 [Firmicutes bacterium]|nr:hypothetical protein [Bacillota bacterium]
MLFKKRISWIVVLIILLSCNSVVWGRSSHEVAIKIAEICRYHLESSRVTVNGDEVIHTIEVSVLNNSDRVWRLLAIQYGNSAGLEWSRDKQVWHRFDPQTGTAPVLSGTRSNWLRYRFFVKVNRSAGNAANLGYQMLFGE